MRQACGSAALQALKDVTAFMEMDDRSLELPEAIWAGLNTASLTSSIFTELNLLDSAFKPEIDAAIESLGRGITRQVR